MSQVTVDVSESRRICSQFIQDLSWLEDYARKNDGDGHNANLLRFAGALVRNQLGPFLDQQPAMPLHVAVVGGAGTGKSTVANLLAGALLAESNPQAGFTRHPIAYVAANSVISWPAHLHFLGPLKKLMEPSPANLDEDVFQIRKVMVNDETPTALGNFVIWDCPDMTTWVASGYIPRLIEIAGLADILVYVASDERYNDEVPTQFLRLMIQARKSVVVCLTKMREADAPAFVDHFRQDVLGKMNAANTPCITIPHLSREALADPIKHARNYQIPLINQIKVMGEPVGKARQRSIKSSMRYLVSEQDSYLQSPKQDLQMIQGWQEKVEQGQKDFEERYLKEYLQTERFHRFDHALVRLLELLELPGVGKILSSALYVVRTPYRLLKNLFSKALQRPPAPAVPERPVLERGMQSWLDGLKKEAARHRKSHALWRHIDDGFDNDLEKSAKRFFDEKLATFQQKQLEEVDRIARAIYEDLEKNPVALNTLRGSKFALEVSAITLTVAAGGLNWFDLVLGPLAASVTHQLVELLGKQYVDHRREQARHQQQDMVHRYIADPMAAWLISWPATGGSQYEKLKASLSRIPQTLSQLEAAVQSELQKVTS